MCQTKPGPRCAGHVSEALGRANEHVAANRAAYEAGTERPHPGAEARLMQLQDEYDETPTGQKVLDEQMINSVGNPARVSDLKNRKANAARRYAVKQAALAATEAGDTRGANIILKTNNPDTGWLSHSRLNPLNSSAYSRMRIDETGGYMVGVISSDTSPEYGYDGNESIAVESSLIYETPIEPGPTPGSYVTHATPAFRRVSDPHLYTEATLDSPFATLRTYDPQTQNTQDAPVTIAEFADTGDVETLTGCDNADDYDVRWDENPDVVHDKSGTPVLLRFYGTATAHVSNSYSSASIA